MFISIVMCGIHGVVYRRRILWALDISVGWKTMHFMSEYANERGSYLYIHVIVYYTACQHWEIGTDHLLLTTCLFRNCETGL